MPVYQSENNPAYDGTDNLEIMKDAKNYNDFIKKLIIDAAPIRCFKYVSDLADENASDEWQKTVANGEQEYIKIFQQIIGGF